MVTFGMYHREFEPPAGLREVIRCFWHNRADTGQARSEFEVVPDGYAEIIFHFGNTLKIFSGDQFQPLPSPFLIGMLNQPARFQTEARLEIIGVRCYPWTVFDMLGLAPGKDAFRFIDHPVATLQPEMEKLMQTDKVEECITLIERFFVDTCSGNPADDTLSKAGTAMREANGSIQVKTVAQAANATVRTLERKFKGSAGHSLKDVAGLIRFEQVRNRLWQQSRPNLAAMAAELGYADQSHLSREFKRYSGSSPAAFAKMARNLKRDGKDFIEFKSVS